MSQPAVVVLYINLSLKPLFLSASEYIGIELQKMFSSNEISDIRLAIDFGSCFNYIYMVFTTEGFLEVAIESWPEWDLNPRPLNSVQTL